MMGDCAPILPPKPCFKRLPGRSVNACILCGSYGLPQNIYGGVIASLWSRLQWLNRSGWAITTRMTFSKINEVIDMPNLIEIQKDSYKWFVEEGLKEVFRDMSDITDYSGNLRLSFVDYRLDDTPKYDVTECKARDTTYAAPLRVTAHLVNSETGEIKESEVSMGDFPLMTESGTFVINGAERAIVSQLVRSPGVYFAEKTDEKTGKTAFFLHDNPEPRRMA